MASIRHATAWDLVEIREYVKRHKGACGLEGAEAVVAVEDGRMIAFGIMQRRGGKPCITIRELRRGKGLGPLIAHHLMEFAGPEQ
ncbi:MAG: GNAT family N-acetyltransferase [Nitrospirota bacterium]